MTAQDRPDLEEMQNDAEEKAVAVPGNGAVLSITKLAVQQEELEATIADLEILLKQKKEQLENVSTVLLPAAMADANVAALTLSNGKEVVLGNFYNGSIMEGMENEFFKWCRDHDKGDVIKNTITVELGKGKDNVAGQIIGDIEKYGEEYEQKTGIHAQTMKAFIKELAEAGELPPAKLLKVFIGQKAKIKFPKGYKGKKAPK